ncbi:fibronectin type III domain-containing protein, partial [Metabacillus niabensis]|uniref:fibronectin type III domain-containing protein n=1 Tax=Metabacillus niabensis TaxID=324854 RepID=UPI0039A0667F
MTLRLAMVLALFVPMLANLGVSSAKAAEVIMTAEDLYFMSENGNYVLGADIDMKGELWQTKSFSGTLNGNGHTIKNFKLATDSTGNAGLFKSKNNLTVRNLKIDNVTTEGELTGTSGVIVSEFVGNEHTKDSSNLTLENITLTNSSIKALSGSYIGGLVGKANSYSATIKNIVVLNTEVQAKSTVGGILGYGRFSNLTLESIIVDADIVVDFGGAGTVFGAIQTQFAGGSVATVRNIASFGTVKQLNVTKGSGSIGGVFGSLGSINGVPTVENITSDVDITGEGAWYYSGIGDGVVNFAVFTGSIDSKLRNVEGDGRPSYYSAGGIGKGPVTRSVSLASKINIQNFVEGNTVTNILHSMTSQNAKNVYALDSTEGNYSQYPFLTKLITEDEAKSDETYKSLGFDMTFTWSTNNGTSYPYLKTLNKLYDGYYEKLSGDAPVLPDLTSVENLKATDVSNTSVSLTWDAVEGATEYDVLRDGVIVGTVATNSFNDSSLKANTEYVYKVVAKDTENSRESSSSDLTVKTDLNPLESPNGLTVSGKTTDSITLTWDAVEGATNYKVERDGQFLASIKDTTYTDSELEENTKYTYKVYAIDTDTNRESQPSTVEGTTDLGDLDSPKNLKQSDITNNSVTIAWDSVENATSYKVFKDGVEIGETQTSSYSVSNLAADTKYTFEVQALDAKTSRQSTKTLLHVKTNPNVPSKPENFQLYGSPSTTSVVLNWDAVEGAEKYTLKRDGVVVYEGTQNSYREDEVLPDGKQYTYTLTATNITGTSEEATLVVDIEVVLPAAPSNLKVTDVTDTTITIAFDEVLGVSGYTVSLNGKDVETITETNYTFTGLTPETSYTIAVTSVSEKGSSKEPSVIEGKTTLAPPTKVEGFKATRITPTTVNLQWDKLDTATEYEVYRDKTVLVYTGALSTFQDVTVSPETQYTYSVRAKNDYGKSAEASTITLTTPKQVEPTPTEPSSTTYNVTFDFKVVEGVSTYKISRNPTWTYESNGDGTYSVSSVNSVTGEKQNLGTVQETEDGYLPFTENLSGSEGKDLTYEIVGYMGKGDNGEPITTDPIEVDVTIPEATETPSDDSLLKKLVVNGGDLNPEFNSSTTDYKVGVELGATLTFVPTANDSNATITIDGIPVKSGGLSQIINTETLPKEVIIEVTAEDRLTKTQYKVTLVDLEDLPTDPGNGEGEEPTTPTEPTDPGNGEGEEPTTPTEPTDPGNGEGEEPTTP